MLAPKHQMTVGNKGKRQREFTLDVNAAVTVFDCAIPNGEDIVHGDTEADLVEDFICVFCIEPLSESCGRVFCRGEELDDVR